MRQLVLVLVCCPIYKKYLYLFFSKVFDVADKGVLNIEKFKDVMASLGEPLPTHEITEIM